MLQPFITDLESVVNNFESSVTSKIESLTDSLSGSSCIGITLDNINTAIINLKANASNTVNECLKPANVFIQQTSVVIQNYLQQAKDLENEFVNGVQNNSISAKV